MGGGGGGRGEPIRSLNDMSSSSNNHSSGERGGCNNGPTRSSGELQLAVLRATPNDKDDLLFRASKDKTGDSKSTATCAHCEQAIAARKEGFFCEVADCPAIYHEQCIEAAVAKVLFDNPALLTGGVILCPMCSNRR